MNINETKEKYAVNTADEAIEMIIGLGYDHDGFSNEKDLKSLIDELVELAVLAKNLMRVPTADVEPVRHGYWILEANHRFSDWGYCDVYVDMKCSRCSKPWHDGNSVWFTTLPNYDENEMPYPITEQRIKDADQRCFQEAKEIAKKYMSCELCGAKMDGEKVQ